MAQKVNIVLIDDLDESEAAETVSFALDGKDFAIDLNARHARELRGALSAYVECARPLPARKPRARRTSSRTRP